MTEPNSKISLEGIYLYINIPFCLKRCRYCYCTLMFPETDLLSWKKNLGSYVDALVKEINSYNGSEKRILGISFGGGTPSLLSVSQFEQILDALRNSCPVLDSKAQVSIEVFPGTKTRQDLEAIRRLGVNRASIGAQSFDDDELRFFGRAHDVETFYKTYHDLRSAGFNDLNIDLLFGLPNTSLNKWEKSVDSALELKPEHLTAYYWYPTLGSDFYSKIAEGSLSGPDRETSISQYQYAIDECASHGLYNYWDFNFARDKKHEYAIERDTFRFFPLKGFGLGAWSQENACYTANFLQLDSYLLDPLKKQQQKCTADYYTMRILMFPQGLVFKEFKEFFNQDWSPEIIGTELRESLNKWHLEGVLDWDQEGIRFNRKHLARTTVYLAELHTKCLYCPTSK